MDHVLDVDPTVTTGIISIRHWSATILFDPDFTYLYVSTYFTSSLDMLCGAFDLLVHVSTPVGDFIVVCQSHVASLI